MIWPQTVLCHLLKACSDAIVSSVTRYLGNTSNFKSIFLGTIYMSQLCSLLCLCRLKEFSINLGKTWAFAFKFLCGLVPRNLNGHLTLLDEICNYQIQSFRIIMIKPSLCTAKFVFKGKSKTWNEFQNQLGNILGFITSGFTTFCCES